MRRRVSLFVGLVLLLTTSGCTLSQVFLYGLLFEIDFPAGVWTRVTCIESSSSGLRIDAGRYSGNGKFKVKKDNKIKKLKFRLSVKEEPEGKTLERMILEYRVKPDGTFDGSSLVKDDFLVPVGYYLCMDLRPKRYDLPLDTIFEFFNCQNDDLLPAADGSSDPGSQH